MTVDIVENWWIIVLDEVSGKLVLSIEIVTLIGEPIERVDILSHIVEALHTIILKPRGMRTTVRVTISQHVMWSFHNTVRVSKGSRRVPETVLRSIRLHRVSRLVSPYMTRIREAEYVNDPNVFKLHNEWLLQT